MFDIGWFEMALIALVALIVIGPKDLPRVMRSASHWLRKARSLGREFQSGVDEMIREADLEDAKKTLDKATSLDLDKAVEDVLDPTGTVEEEAHSIAAAARDAAEGQESDAEDGSGADGADDGDSDGEDDETAGGATIVKHPLQVAPPHSLTPPPAEAEEAAPPPGDDTSKKRA